ncbi:hypothetical protein ACFV06_41480, partial [Streptomyces sp. NPDC059618]|uniref:hypothetical protein n=1 Tax=Streptomyces sp. NPDC059618 TaxID=3346887 RepID=UPI0036B3CB3D
EYERILDEALRSAPHHPELAAVGQRLNPEQLRTMALNASALITVAAAAEYQHYVKVREELRHPAPATPSTTSETGSAEPGTAAMGLATTMGEAAQAAEAAAILVAMVALLLTALRNRPSLEAGPYSELSEEVDQAREAWREALLARGILPFLQEALTDPGTATALHTTPSPPAPTGRLPKIGYDRPGFTSPDDGRSTGPRPSFSSPDYTSPDFGGPE